MSSHGTVVDSGGKGGFTLRELDDSRRGARFSNKKEDKLLERRLAYLTKQNKRVQVSINREKEFIKTRKTSEDDKEMNHLNRRYKEAMGFIMEYKADDILNKEHTSSHGDKSSDPKKTAWAKCSAIQRIRSAPLCAQTKRADRHDSHSSTEGRREAWLHTRVSKMSLDSETTSFSNQSECSDSGSDGEDVLRPFVRKEFRKFRGSSGESCESSKETQSSSDSSRVSLRRQYHRPQSGVKNASFWSVLRQNQNSRPSVVEEGEESKPRNSLAKKAKDVMLEQRVLKLFIGVDKLKNSRVKLPDI